MIRRIGATPFVPALLASLAFAALAGCGGGGASGGDVVVSGKPFTLEAANDPKNDKAQDATLARLAKTPPAAVPDVAIAVTGTQELTGLDLASGKTWTSSHAFESRPRLAGAIVLGQGGGEVFALDAKTGASKWTTKKVMGKLIGGGSDGDLTALTSKTADGYRLYVIGADGSVIGEKSTDVELAAPGIAGNTVLVPWKAQFVTAFDARSGDQLATFSIKNETTRVIAIGGSLYLGQGRLFRLDAKLPKVEASDLIAPPQNIPGVFRRELYVAPQQQDPPKATAIDQTFLAGRPSPTGATFEQGKIYGAYYRLLMGLDATSSKPAWVVASKEDYIAAAATRDGVVAVDEGGNVQLIAASNGAVTKTLSFGKPAMAAEVEVDALTVGKGEAPALTKQIGAALSLRTADLATAQVFLVQALASIEDEDATLVLLDVADDPRAAQVLRDEARTQLATRKNGAEAMMKRLERHASFLRDTVAPPVGPIATSLALQGKKEAVPLLLAHLLDPATPSKDLAPTATAIATLATAADLPGMKRFIVMYRGSAQGTPAISDAVGILAGGVLKLGDAKDRAWVKEVAADPTSDVDVRTTLAKLIEERKSAEGDKAKGDDKAGDDDKAKDDGKGKKKPKKDDDDGPVPGGYKGKKKKG
jgi:outer membrane protein assembly factor BamB